MMDSLQGDVPLRVAKYVDGICQPQLEFLDNYVRTPHARSYCQHAD